MKEKEAIRLNELKKYEDDLHKKGYNYICGIDEAGRGPLAGPVVVAAAIMPQGSFIEGVNDSKKISEKKREIIYEQIIKEAIAWSVAIIDQEEIDRINILNAPKKGVTECIKKLSVKPEIIAIDALEHIDTCGIPYDPIIKGDAKVYSISAASIIAKVTRDRMMREWDEEYPVYEFGQNKGYGTAKHIAAIKQFGICQLHRKSFVKHFINE